MKKNVLIKGILVLVAIAVFAIVFVGCLEIYTVNIVVTGLSFYNIKMDGIMQYTVVSQGTYAICNSTYGNHFFEAIHYLGPGWGYYSVTQYIIPGVNTVNLYP